MSKPGEEGIAGAFEDIPVLIVVTIATGIFLFSLVHAYVVYLEQLESQRMYENANDLLSSVRSYEGLTHEFREGVFLGDKLITLTSEALREDYDPNVLGFDYQISIIDTSDYPNCVNYTMSFSSIEEPPTKNRYSVTTSISIKVDEDYHAGQLIVMIWG
ncbi:MAG: hypothetical protein JSW00_11025 [Thermoplasmata archaeon]|nr:MAG: hypothetical protein JSW00_11025 [Thermoplasmata archaeon]